MSGLIAALAAALFFAGCSRAPDTVPLPEQRRSWSGPPARPLGAILRVSDPHAHMYIAGGVEFFGDRRWRWAARRVELRLWPSEERAFFLRLFIAAQTFERTGPVTVSALIGGRLLGRFRCDAPREFTFEKSVPTGWIAATAPTTVVLETSPVWKNEHAFLLVEAGFR